jgi:quercetin dioxygenase-like cupin family protein
MKFAGLLANCLIATCLLLGALPAVAEETPPVVVTPVMKSAVTATGQPIQLPQKDAEIQVSTYDIAVGAKLPVHKHPFPRYAYVLAGKIEVTNTEAGTVAVYETGGFIIEAVGQWHKASNIGTEPVKLLVIDMIEAGQNNVVKQLP